MWLDLRADIETEFRDLVREPHGCLVRDRSCEADAQRWRRALQRHTKAKGRACANPKCRKPVARLGRFGKVPKFCTRACCRSVINAKHAAAHPRVRDHRAEHAARWAKVKADPALQAGHATRVKAWRQKQRAA